MRQTVLDSNLDITSKLHVFGSGGFCSKFRRKFGVGGTVAMTVQSFR